MVAETRSDRAQGLRLVSACCDDGTTAGHVEATGTSAAAPVPAAKSGCTRAHVRTSVAEMIRKGAPMTPATADGGRDAVPLVSVIVVSWNSAPELERCLNSILERTVSTSVEIIVVDNASRDRTKAMLRARFPNARLIANRENVGFARACNHGMAAARGELLLLLNSDTYVVDDVIGRAARRLLERPEIGMLGCEVAFPDGRRQHTANRALSIWRGLVKNLWLYKLLPPGRSAELLLGGYWEEDWEIEVDWLAGAFLLLRRGLFEQSGGFDPRFFMYGEDSEWCMRLRRLGHRILYAPGVGTVYHLGSVSSDLVWTEEERLRLCHRGGIESYASLHGWRRAQLYRFSELIGAAMRLCMYRVASFVRPREYYSKQAAFYGLLVRFYLAPTTGQGVAQRWQLPSAASAADGPVTPRGAGRPRV
jgi:N-acetylglucosaminyl-diphospho-decaprenol L-rhamnosyltransferase